MKKINLRHVRISCCDGLGSPQVKVSGWVECV